MNQECDRCKRIFDSGIKYEKHIKSNKCKEPYTCDVCDYITKKKDHFERHINTKKCKDNRKVEEKKKLFACPDCNKSFRDNHHLSRHLHRKNPCNIASIINNNNNTTNNTMNNCNNKTIIINAHDPSAFLKDLSKVDRAIYNNLLQSFSINSPESIEKLNDISPYVPYKNPKIISKDKSRYSEEFIESQNNESCRLANEQYLSQLLHRTFFDPDDLEYAPFFKIPNTKKIGVKHDNGLKELDYDIISQLTSNITHKMNLLEKEEFICLNRIKKSIDESYETIRNHFIKKIKNLKM